MNRVILVSLAVAAALLGPVSGSATAEPGEICAWEDYPFAYPVPREVCVPVQCGSICNLINLP